MLDGFPIEVGDLVFDIVLQRTGVVVFVGPNGTCSLDFGNGQIVRYGTGGTFAGVKRLYWLDPIISVPKKRDPQWLCIRAVVAALRSTPCS